jgi:hypothetical protein
MIAAIYARKSTEQTRVAGEQNTVARQIDHARAYATRKGWIVPDEHVYVDDPEGKGTGSRPPGVSSPNRTLMAPLASTVGVFNPGQPTRWPTFTMSSMTV